MKKRIFSLILAAVMLAGSAACSDAPQNADDTAADIDAQTSAGADSSAEEVPEETQEYQDPSVTFDGATFTIEAVDCYVKGGGFWSAQNYCEVYADITGDVLHDSLYERNNQVEELLDINLEVMSITEFGALGGEELKKAVLSDDSIIDMASLTGTSLGAVLTSGVLLNLYNVPSVDFSHSWWDKSSLETFQIMDTLYAVTGDFNLQMAYAPIIFYFNKQLVDLHDLGDPYTMVQEGTWTLDEFIRMSETVSADTNGNGKVDYTDDNFGIMLEGLSMSAMAASCAIPITATNAEGVPEIVIDQERASSMVEKMQNLIFTDNVTMFAGRISGYSNVFRELFLPTFTENRALFFFNQLLVAMDLREMETDFGILPSPKYDEAQENYACPVNYWWATFDVIPITNGRLEMTGHIMDALGFYSQQYVTPAYMEKTIQGKTLRDEESIAMLDIILGNRVYDLAAIYNWGNIFTMFDDFANSQRAQFASAYKSRMKMAGKAIQRTLSEIEDQ